MERKTNAMKLKNRKKKLHLKNDECFFFLYFLLLVLHENEILLKMKQTHY
jgi:hypothetical protein